MYFKNITFILAFQLPGSATNRIHSQLIYIQIFLDKHHRASTSWKRRGRSTAYCRQHIPLWHLQSFMAFATHPSTKASSIIQRWPRRVRAQNAVLSQPHTFTANKLLSDTLICKLKLVRSGISFSGAMRITYIFYSVSVVMVYGQSSSQLFSRCRRAISKLRCNFLFKILLMGVSVLGLIYKLLRTKATVRSEV